MPVTHNRPFLNDRGVKLEVDFEISHFTSADMELTAKDAWRFRDRDNPDAARVELSDAEFERFEAEVALHVWDYIE